MFFFSESNGFYRLITLVVDENEVGGYIYKLVQNSTEVRISAFWKLWVQPSPTPTPTMLTIYPASYPTPNLELLKKPRQSYLGS
jgi:hypothetical protein